MWSTSTRSRCHREILRPLLSELVIRLPLRSAFRFCLRHQEGVELQKFLTYSHSSLIPHGSLHLKIFRRNFVNNRIDGGTRPRPAAPCALAGGFRGQIDPPRGPRVPQGARARALLLSARGCARPDGEYPPPGPPVISCVALETRSRCGSRSPRPSPSGAPVAEKPTR